MATKAARKGSTVRRGTVAIAGDGANVVPSHGGDRIPVAPGTRAVAGQGYVTWIGTTVHDWTVDGMDGDFQIYGTWTEDEGSAQ